MPDPDLQRREYHRRLRLRSAGNVLSSVLLLLVGISAWGLFPAADAAGTDTDPRAQATFLSSIGFQRDTVFTTMPNFIEVDLDSQRLHLHHRDGSTNDYPVSTGTSTLTKGIDTRTGIFLVQNKMEWLYSLQFDSTKVFNWLGFNFGVGFHSLAGRGYYRNLGRRPSSHGCIRLKEEDAKALYSQVRVGTPVFVHGRSYARVVAFADTTARGAQLPARAVLASHERRLHDLYQGARLSRDYPLLMLDRASITHAGLPAGDASRIPVRQRIPRAAGDVQFGSRERTLTVSLRRTPTDSDNEEPNPSRFEDTILP